MSSFDVDHWLQHDREAHRQVFLHGTSNSKSPNTFVYQQVTCGVKSTTTTTATAAAQPASLTVANTQLTKHFESFTEFMNNYKQLAAATSTPGVEAEVKLMPCLICGADMRFTLIDILKHFQCEHEFNIMLNMRPLPVTLDTLEILHMLILNNCVQVCEGVYVRRRCFIRVPPLLTVVG